MVKDLFTLCLLALLPSTAIADDTPASVALLVNEANADIVAARVGPALGAKDSVTRAAAARVALVRGLTSVRDTAGWLQAIAHRNAMEAAGLERPLRVKAPAEPFDGRREQAKKQEPVAVLPENVLPFIASGCDVPESTFELKSQRS